MDVTLSAEAEKDGVVARLAATFVPHHPTTLTVAGLALILSAGCTLMPQSGNPASRRDEVSAAVDIIPITAATLADLALSPSVPDTPAENLPPPVADRTYRVGPGDVLSIIVYDHPQLTIPAGPQRTASEAGNTIQVDGTIYYPFIGSVDVAGKTVAEVRTTITEGLRTVIPDPQVDVRVAQFHSRRLHLSGAVNKPGAVRITNVPLRVSDVLAAGGGHVPDVADLARVKLVREGKTYEIDVAAYLYEGDGRHDPLVQDGDQIIVPDRPNDDVYVLGEVERPGALTIGDTMLSLTDALARSGGIASDSASARGIFVFRRAAGQETLNVYQLDARDPTAFLLGVGFALRQKDVVYVTAAPATRWRRLVGNLVPSLTVLNSLLLLDNVSDR